MNERPVKGFLGRIFHNRSDDACFACGTPFEAGPASRAGRSGGLQAHFYNYVGMTVFLAGLGAVVVMLPARIFVGPGALTEILHRRTE